MKTSATNMLRQAADVVERSKDGRRYGYAFVLREISGHLEELARRHRAGDAKAIEEFIDLYDLEPKKPTP